MRRVPFQTGFEGLLRGRDALLQGKRIAMVIHPASLTASGTWTPAALRAHGEGKLVALLGPEHGVFGHGAAGETIASTEHPRWGIPVYSLYGESRKPSAEMLEGVDILLVDLQDLAVRCYTYVATLKGILEVAAERGITVIVTDRPVPFAEVTDGPLPEPGKLSFVCGINAPLVYGMTPAEAAQWIVRTEKLSVDLQVVPMQGYTRDRARRADWAPWVPPSTGIRSWETALCYPATVFTEALPSLDCDREGLLPFQVLGATWMDGDEVVRHLEGARLAGVRVVPHEYICSDGTLLPAVRLIVTDARIFRPVTTGFRILDVLQHLYGTSTLWDAEGTRPEFFDKLCGSPAPREALLQGVPVDELARLWNDTHTPFLEDRAACLLYSPEAGS
jgi:uncharacterized protein YbbC (DUF1343 family)